MVYESPVWEDCYKPDTWTSMFPGVLHPERGSIEHVKKLIAVGFSCITFLRNVFPQVAYEMRVVDDLHVALLVEDCGILCPNMFVDLLYSAFEAIERKYLQELSLVFFDEDCEVVQEMYTFKIKYLEGGEATLTELVGCNKRDIDKKISVKGPTLNLLRAIILLTESMKPLPDSIAIRFYVNYYDRETPRSYQPRGFMAVPPLQCDYQDTLSMKIGSVKTLFHSVQLHSTVRHSLLDENVMVTSQSNNQVFTPERIAGKCKQAVEFEEENSGAVARQYSVKYLGKTAKQNEETAALPMSGQVSMDIGEQNTNSNHHLSGHDTVANKMSCISDVGFALADGLDSASSEPLTQQSLKKSGDLQLCCHPLSCSSNSRSADSSLEFVMRCPCGLKSKEDVLLICSYCGHYQHMACFRVLDASNLPVDHVCELCAKAGKPCTDPLLQNTSLRYVRETCILRLVYAYLTKVQGRHTINSLAEHFGLDRKLARMVSTILHTDGAFLMESQPHVSGRLVNAKRLSTCLIPRYFQKKELPALCHTEMVQASELLEIQRMFQEEQRLSESIRGSFRELATQDEPVKCVLTNGNRKLAKEKTYTHHVEKNEDRDAELESKVTDDESLRLCEFETSGYSHYDDSLDEVVEKSSEFSSVDEGFDSSQESGCMEDSEEDKSFDSSPNVDVLALRKREMIKDFLVKDFEGFLESDKVISKDHQADNLLSSTEMKSHQVSSNSHLINDQSNDKGGNVCQVDIIKDRQSYTDKNNKVNSLPCAGYPYDVTSEGQAYGIDGNLEKDFDIVRSKSEIESNHLSSAKSNQPLNIIPCHQDEKPGGENFDSCSIDNALNACTSSTAVEKLEGCHHSFDVKNSQAVEERRICCDCSDMTSCHSDDLNNNQATCDMHSTSEEKSYELKKGSESSSSIQDGCNSVTENPNSMNSQQDLLEKVSPRFEKKPKFFKSKAIGTSAPKRLNSSQENVRNPKFFKMKGRTEGNNCKNQAPVSRNDTDKSSLAVLDGSLQRNQNDDVISQNLEDDHGCCDRSDVMSCLSEDFGNNQSTDSIQSTMEKNFPSLKIGLNSYQNDTLEKLPHRFEKKPKFFKSKTNSTSHNNNIVYLASQKRVDKPKFFKTKVGNKQNKIEYQDLSDSSMDGNIAVDLNSSRTSNLSTTSMPILDVTLNRNPKEDPYTIQEDFEEATFRVPLKRKRWVSVGSPYEDFGEQEDDSKVSWKRFKMRKRTKQVWKNSATSV